MLTFPRATHGALRVARPARRWVTNNRGRQRNAGDRRRPAALGDSLHDDLCLFPVTVSFLDIDERVKPDRDYGITGDDRDGSLKGGAGSVTMVGGGHDWLISRGDHDTVIGETGADTMDSGAGKNTADHCAVLLGSSYVYGFGRATSANTGSDTLIDVTVLLVDRATLTATMPCSSAVPATITCSCANAAKT